MITVNIIKPINEVILKQDKIEVLIDKKNVELLTIDKVILKEPIIVSHQYTDVPLTRDSYGVTGQQAFDDDYFYICVAPNKWARTLLMKGW